LVASTAGGSCGGGSGSGGGLHSSTFELNVSTFFGIRWLASLCQWPKRLRFSRNVDECKPLGSGAPS
jgi:hypothetical protein